MFCDKILHGFTGVIFAFVSISSITSAQSDSRCPRRYHMLHDRLCYRFGSKRVVWTEANQRCSRDGGSLFSSTSVEDVDDLRQIMSRSQDESGTAFIGVIDRSDGAGYANADKSLIWIQFWLDGGSPPPQELGDPRCAFVSLPGEGRWESGMCGAKRKFLCVYVPNNVKERNARRKQIRCHVCNGVSTNDQCNAQGTILCPPNAGSCQNEVRVVNGEKTITKRCKQTRACQNNYIQNSKATWLEAQCKPGRRGSSVCRCCCQGDECNAGELPCLAKGCKPLRVPKGGEVACTDEYMLGSLCTFTCDFGFTLSGSDTIRCMEGRKWTSRVPQCTRTRCSPEKSDPKDGSVTCTDGNHGASVCRFKCKYGYYLRGLSITTCLGTGKWSVQSPTCHLIQCSPALREPKNGRFLVRKPSTFGAITTFACNEKYFMVGSPSVRCSDRNSDGIGEWNNRAPTCRLITCLPSLNAPANGRVGFSTNNNELGTVASFECKEGYFLRGNDTITCNGPTKSGNGRWGGEEPKCTEIMCQVVSAPDNGEDIQSTRATPRFGTVLAFACKFGYFLVGSKTSTCRDMNGDGEGEWTEPRPRCKQILCSPTLNAPPNGRFLYNGGDTFSAVTEFSCDEGFFLMGDARVICRDENKDGVGEWSSGTPTCRQILCLPMPTAPNNGGMVCSDKNDYGTTCNFECDKSFFRSGAKNTVCMDENGDGVGEWTNPTPSCIEIVCPSIPLAPANGRVSCSDGNFFRSNCEFFCNDGYWLQESEPSVCQNDGRSAEGRWSKITPHCYEITCGHSQSTPDHGFVTCDNGQNFGSACTYSCTLGYFLIGNVVSTCRDVNNDGQGEWDNVPPLCKPSVCVPALNAVEFGEVTCDDTNRYGSVCVFECKPGYKINGEASISCGEPRNEDRAMWSADAPTCTKRFCDEVTAPPGGRVECTDKATLGSQCTFSCENNRFLNGDTTRSCVAKGAKTGSTVEWNRPSPLCELITCTQMVAESAQLQISCTDDRLVFGTVCVFECSEGYALIGGDETKCAGPTSRAIGSWTAEVPTCSRIRCEPESRNPVNGTVECEGNNVYGSTCNYQCAEGYSLIGERTRRCQDDSAWSDLEPKCERMACEPPLEAPENGIITCTQANFVGTICQSFCDLGFDMIGRMESRCVVDESGAAEYTNPGPKCDPIYCTEIEGAVEGGNIICGVGQGDVENNRYDTTCFLSCDDAWRAEGPTRTTCVGFGDWEETLGKCERIICQPPLSKPPRGDVSCNSRVNVPGTVCTYTCNNGLQVDNGHDIVTCNENGKWSADPPACVSP